MMVGGCFVRGLSELWSIILSTHQASYHKVDLTQIDKHRMLTMFGNTLAKELGLLNGVLCAFCFLFCFENSLGTLLYSLTIHLSSKHLVKSKCGS